MPDADNLNAETKLGGWKGREPSGLGLSSLLFLYLGRIVSDFLGGCAYVDRRDKVVGRDLTRSIAIS